MDGKNKCTSGSSCIWRLQSISCSYTILFHKVVGTRGRKPLSELKRLRARRLAKCVECVELGFIFVVRVFPTDFEGWSHGVIFYTEGIQADVDPLNSLEPSQLQDKSMPLY